MSSALVVRVTGLEGTDAPGSSSSRRRPRAAARCRTRCAAASRSPWTRRSPRAHSAPTARFLFPQRRRERPDARSDRGGAHSRIPSIRPGLADAAARVVARRAAMFRRRASRARAEAARSSAPSGSQPTRCRPAGRAITSSSPSSSRAAAEHQHLLPFGVARAASDGCGAPAGLRP